MRFFVSSAALLVTFRFIWCEQFAIYSHDMSPDPGPELDTVYVPGSPGAAWSEAEIRSTRARILQAIHPDWDVMKELYDAKGGRSGVTENRIMRLAFHDCVKYTDGTGGCDGCLNWKGVGADTPNPNVEEDFYNFSPVNATDNNGLEHLVEALEKIYTNIDWPFQEASLSASLQQLGKSRADLWQFAGLVALERALERANRACDLDYWARQQVTLLEGREACEFKLKAPLKFWSGRTDCVSEDKDGRGYKAAKQENQPRLLGDAVHATDYFLNDFDMSPEHSQALQAVHGAVHSADVGVKYSWLGAGYISNMYYKWIANHATYDFEHGGDLSFDADLGANVEMVAYGDKEGKPRNQTGWRASCMYLWDTPEGGPCFMRPTGSRSADSPDPTHDQMKYCLAGFDEDWNAQANTKDPWCRGSSFIENNIQVGGKYMKPNAEVKGPFSEVDMNDTKERQNRHNTGWSNIFAFPWEVSAYWDFTTRTEHGQHAIGCPGLDTPFEEWPMRNLNSEIYATAAMDCGKQTYMGLADIVEKFASDQQYWSVKFLEAWDIMATNGQPHLEAGPEAGWLGHYSLDKAGRLASGDSLETLITEAGDSGLIWTDPQVDPTICGHRGHFTTSCAFSFSFCINNSINGNRGCVGNGPGPDFIP